MDHRYEEALERARKGMPIDEVFPELKESEDERIRNLIYCLIRDRSDNRKLLEHNGVSVDDALAYLERQKEQKPVNLNDDITLGLDRALQIIKEAKGVLGGYQTDDGVYECDHAIQTLERILKNGIEQKSAHTAKEVWKEMRLEVYAQASGNRHEPNYSDDSTKMFSLCDIDEIFEKIGNYTVGSQPAEWSEEDENKFDLLHTCIRHCINDPHWEYSKREKVSKEIIPFIEKLKSLRPQPKQEWSKEDEVKIKVLDSLIRYIVEVIDKDVLERFGTNYEELFSWLKSLRPQPHWKPSEEQMKVFLKATPVNLMPEELSVYHSLCTDIQKLM